MALRNAKRRPPTEPAADALHPARGRWFLALVACLVTLPPMALGEVIEQELAVREGELLQIDLATGGSLEIVGGNRNTVALTAVLGGRDAEISQVQMEKTPVGVRLSSYHTARRDGYRSIHHFTVRVPRRFDLHIESGGGGVRIKNVDGAITGKTLGGSLHLERLQGELRFTTLGGEIHLRDSHVDGELKTLAGEVVFEDVSGDINGTSMEGNVLYRNVTTPHGRTGQALVISSLGGDIDLAEAPEGVDCRTLGGDITIGSAAKFVHAQTMKGDIRIDAVMGWVKATTMAGNVSVTMTGEPGSGGSVEIHARGGEVHLTVPDDLSMEVDIELAYTQDRGTGYEVVSDFPLSQREGEDWTYDRRPLHRTVRSTGTVGSGENQIRIRALNGGVYLRRASGE